MTVDDVRPLVRAMPFAPFRIDLSDGRTFDVTHPEFISVGRTAINVVTPTEEHDHHHYLSVRQITGINVLPPADTAAESINPET